MGFQSTLPRGERPCRILCCVYSISISIHAPARGATIVFEESVACDNISIHAPARGATLLNNTHFVSSSFQSTLPRGERPNLPTLSIAPFKFQSTLPRGERHNDVNNACVCSPNFNPRSREGSDSFTLMMPPTQAISIHAPARGATCHTSSYRRSTLIISIHAPARGATYEVGDELPDSEIFQSTLPRGERRR